MSPIYGTASSHAYVLPRREGQIERDVFRFQPIWCGQYTINTGVSIRPTNTLDFTNGAPTGSPVPRTPYHTRIIRGYERTHQLTNQGSTRSGATTYPDSSLGL